VQSVAIAPDPPGAATSDEPLRRRPVRPLLCFIAPLQRLMMEGPEVASNSAAQYWCRRVSGRAGAARTRQHPLPKTVCRASINPQMMKLRKGVDVLRSRQVVCRSVPGKKKRQVQSGADVGVSRTACSGPGLPASWKCPRTVPGRYCFPRPSSRCHPGDMAGGEIPMIHCPSISAHAMRGGCRLSRADPGGTRSVRVSRTVSGQTLAWRYPRETCRGR
jgi:hypothetical protein